MPVQKLSYVPGFINLPGPKESSVPLSSISSVVVPSEVSPNAFVFPNADANDQAQIPRGDRPYFQDGVVSESAPALPKMSAFERADLSRMAGRELNEEQARKFWRSLVIAAAIQQLGGVL